jgi:hypothetical protein
MPFSGRSIAINKVGIIKERRSQVNKKAEKEQGKKKSKLNPKTIQTRIKVDKQKREGKNNKNQ